MKVFFKEWMKEQRKKLALVYPNMDKATLDKFLEDQINKNCRDPKCILDNTYIHQQAHSSLLDIIDYIDKTKPIIAGFGVLYKPQRVLQAPEAIWLDDTLAARKSIKKKLHLYTPGSYQYMQTDNAQLDKKILANSYYGANGNKASTFYNSYTAPSVTASGQSLISTAETAFESFYANNVKFYCLDDVLLYISNIIHEDYECKFDIKLDAKTVFAKLFKAFHRNYDQKSDKLLMQVLEGLSQSELQKVYFKSNLFQFIQINSIEQRFLKIFLETESFKDPNNVPEAIHAELDTLWDLLYKYVVYDYPTPNRINRLKFEKRKVVVVIDTDSNMLNISGWINYWLDNYVFDKMKTSSDDELVYIIANSLCYIMTQLTKCVLKTYAKHNNIQDDYAPRLNMKNEFFYRRMVLTDTKKRYVGIVRLREGNELKPEKLDVKGVDWAKSTASERTKEFFNTLIKKDILYSETINTAGILRSMHEFKTEIRESVESGNKQFLTPISIKNPEAYKTPWSTSGIRQVFFWNAIYPDMQIQLPDNVVLADLKLTRLNQIEDFASKHQDIYQALVNGVYLNPVYLQYTKALKIKPDDNISIMKAMAKTFNSIAIPTNAEIPQWVFEYIDMDKIVQDNISKFFPITKSLGLPTLETHSNEPKLTNIIEF